MTSMTASSWTGRATRQMNDDATAVPSSDGEEPPGALPHVIDRHPRGDQGLEVLRAVFAAGLKVHREPRALERRHPSWFGRRSYNQANLGVHGRQASHQLTPDRFTILFRIDRKQSVIDEDDSTHDLRDLVRQDLNVERISDSRRSPIAEPEVRLRRLTSAA